MQNRMVRKGLVIGIVGVFFLMLLIPISTADVSEEEYPLSGGPYEIYFRGYCNGGAAWAPVIDWFWVMVHYLQTGKTYGGQIGPFANWEFPHGPGFTMEPESYIEINGEVTILEEARYYDLWGFNGYAPGLPLCLISTLADRKIRVYGVADAIYMH